MDGRHVEADVRADTPGPKKASRGQAVVFVPAQAKQIESSHTARPRVVQLLMDWSGIEFGVIYEKCFQGCTNAISTLSATITKDLRELLQSYHTVEQCVEWLQQVTDNFLGFMKSMTPIPNQALPDLVETVRQLLENFAYYSSLISRVGTPAVPNCSIWILTQFSVEPAIERPGAQRPNGPNWGGTEVV